MQPTSVSALLRAELVDAYTRGEQKLVDNMRLERVFQAGDQLFLPGAAHDYVWRVRTGWCCRSRYLPNRKRQIVIVFLPNDLLGIKSMLMETQVDALEFLTPATLVGIEQSELHELARQDYDLSARLMWQLSEEERRLHKWVVGLGVCNAEERTAAMLLDFYGRLEPLGFVRDNSFSLPLTQQQMGDHLGLTFVHVNRVLQRLRLADIAVVKGGRATIMDMDRLRELARPMNDLFENRASTAVEPSSSLPRDEMPIDSPRSDEPVTGGVDT